MITIGVAGLINYIGLLPASIWKMLQDAKKKLAVIVIVSVLICHSVQAFASINVPMVAPVMLTLMMAGLSTVRDTRSHLPEDTIAGGLNRCYTG